MIYNNIFISYSWDNEEHKCWVKKLADKLEEIYEINISFDQYDLDSFGDKNLFMEKSVFETDLILVVITEEYTGKANNRSNGVGIETSMITSRHWDEYLSSGKSNIIPILRSGSSPPNYLKNKFYIDFRADNNFDSIFQLLLRHINGTSKANRPPKKYSISTPQQIQELTRAEDFLKINYKNRKLVFDKNKTTDYSGDNKIKFELWETKSPSIEYYLFLFKNISIEKSIQRLALLIKENNIKISNITVLKNGSSKKGYLDSLLKDNNLSITIEELTYSQYIWEYCIDNDAKNIPMIYTRPNFIDQSIISDDELKEDLGPAFDYFKNKLSEDEQSVANIIIAPGGTGKTTLCSNLANYYQRENNIIPVFIESEEMKKHYSLFSKKHIKSIFDLYDSYSSVCINQENEYIFNKITFEVAVLTGKLILIIDGLDEIIPLFQDGFDIDQFLKSIDELNKQMNSSKIIITSRNDVITDKLMATYSNINKFLLLGFDEDTCERYLQKRFKPYENKSKMIQSVQTNITPLISKDENQRILPFIVDLLSSIVEDSSGLDSKFELSFEDKDYESNEDITDYLVYSILRRESVRQSLEISINEVLDIFLELSISHSDNFPVQDLKDIVDAYYPEIGQELTEKLLRNPLISKHPESNLCNFKYDFIFEYFNTLNIIKFINNNLRGEQYIKLISKHANGEGIVYGDVFKYYNMKKDTAQDTINNIINVIKSELGYEDAFKKNNYKIRAMSFLIHIILDLNTQKTKTERMEVLKSTLGDDKKINFLSIYGNTKSLDFSNTHIVNSVFVGYKNFTRSKFSNTKFSNCVFDNINNKNISIDLGTCTFDSCQMGDLDTVISIANNRSNENRTLIEKELRQFFTSFYNRGRFIDQKKSYIKFSDRVKNINDNFFDYLLSNDVIEIKTEKSDETYFKINSNIQDSVYTLIMNNTVDKKIKPIVNFLCSK